MNEGMNAWVRAVQKFFGKVSKSLCSYVRMFLPSCFQIYLSLADVFDIPLFSLMVACPFPSLNINSGSCLWV